LNNLHVKQTKSIEVNRVAQVPLHAIWLWCQEKMVYNTLDCIHTDDLSDSKAEKRFMTVASIVQGQHLRLMSLLDNYHTSSLIY